MSKSPPLTSVAAKVEAALQDMNVTLTLGGEPTYVPIVQLALRKCFPL